MKPTTFLKATIGLLGLVIAHPVFAQETGVELSAVNAQIDKAYPDLDRLYVDLHSHPELGFQEIRTAGLLAARMRKLGFDVTEKVGGTGLVALYHNGAGPVVMVRTELDALPVEEKTGLPYASHVRTQFEGKPTFVAQACGHDNHMAWWIGTAEALVALKAQWHGTLMFIAQPGEEPGTGATAMLKDGLFTRFPKPDFAFAGHVSPGVAGSVLVKDGPVTSADDAMEIIFKGRGGHGSMPSETIDPIVMGAHFVTDVQSVVSRQKDAFAFGVISVGSFQAGQVENIIPDTATLKLTVRSFDPSVRKTLVDGVQRTAEAVATMAGAPMPTVNKFEGSDAVINDHSLFLETARTLSTRDRDDNIDVQPASAPGWAASEDYFAFVEAGVPSLYFMIGGYDAATIASYHARGLPVPTNHSPFFAPDHEKAIRTGVRVLTLAVLGVTHLSR